MTGDAIDRVSDQPGPVGQSEAVTMVILIMIQDGICLDQDVASELNILSELAPLVIDAETYVSGLTTQGNPSSVIIKVLEVSFARI